MSKNERFDMAKGFDSFWLGQHLARVNAPMNRQSAATAPQDAVACELDLHLQIIAECKRRGWKYVHSDMSRRTTCGDGVCDFIIYADQGRMFNVECKSQSGKLSTEQMAFTAWLQKLGHTTHVVRSFSEFIDVVNCSTKNIPQ